MPISKLIAGKTIHQFGMNGSGGSNRAYKVGDVVMYPGTTGLTNIDNPKLYVCTSPVPLGQTGAAPGSNIPDGRWHELNRNPFRGAWFASFVYLYGDIVIQLGGTVYLCIVASTTQTPTAGATDWKLLG